MTDDSDQSAPQKRRFPKTKVRMPNDQARRQGEIVTLAFTTLGSRDAALDFLNSHHITLDARPLDVASESAEGFAQVREMIAAGSTA